MRSVSFLLCLMLCLVLAVNGTGLAQARMHADAAHAGAVAMEPAADSGCHGARTAEAPKADTAPVAPLQGDAAGCCDDGDACSCACMVLTPLAFAVPELPGVLPASDAGVPLVATRHRPPRLPHRIRPPIG